MLFCFSFLFKLSHQIKTGLPFKYGIRIYNMKSLIIIMRNIPKIAIIIILAIDFDLRINLTIKYEVNKQIIDPKAVGAIVPYAPE